MNIKESSANLVKDLIINYREDSRALKSVINFYPRKDKGHIFEELVAELYRGNGWLAEVVGGRNDGGADILLYYPTAPDIVVFIIQAKNHAKPLSYDNTKIELVKFEEKGKKKCTTSNYKLVTVNGFVKDAISLERFKLALHDWKYIEELLLSYGEHTKPHLELMSHNKEIGRASCRERV